MLLPLISWQDRLAVFIENSGFGGSSAAPAAGLMMEKYLRGHVVSHHKRMEDWIKYGNLTVHLQTCSIAVLHGVEQELRGVSPRILHSAKLPLALS